MSVKNKYVTYVFEDGEVYVEKKYGLGRMDLKGFVRKLGKFKGLKPFDKDEFELFPYHVTYRYYPHAKRVLRFNRRQAIKKSLPKAYVRYAGWARKLSKSLFLSKVPPDFNNVVRSIGYKDAEHFWQVNKYPDKKLPGRD